MTAPADDDILFKRMFASFVARKTRPGPSTAVPNQPPPPDALRRTTSEHKASKSKHRGGIAALLSPAGLRSPVHRSSHSSSSLRNSPSGATTAAGGSASSSALNQYRHSPAQYHSTRDHYDQPSSYSQPGRQSKGGRSSMPFSPLGRSSSGAIGSSRRHSAKSSDKTVSTEEDRPPRKRSRTHTIVRSQSAHAGSLHQQPSSRKLEKQKSRTGGRSSRAGSPARSSQSGAPSRNNSSRTANNGATRQFPCEKCDSVFAQRGQLSRHTRRVHDKLRPHACEYCGRLFGARSDRTRHIQVRRLLQSCEASKANISCLSRRLTTWPDAVLNMFGVCNR